MIKTHLEFCQKPIISGNIKQPYKLWSQVYQILPHSDVIKDYLPNIKITREMLEQVKQKCEEMIRNGAKDAATQQSVYSIFTASFESILDGFKINGKLRELFIESSKAYFSADRDPKQIFSEICKEIDETTKSNPGETYDLFKFCKDDDDESREETYNAILDGFKISGKLMKCAIVCNDNPHYCITRKKETNGNDILVLDLYAKLKSQHFLFQDNNFISLVDGLLATHEGSDPGKVFLKPRNLTPDQNFVFETDGTIGKEGDLSMVLDIEREQVNSGSNILFYWKHRRFNQIWRLISVEEEY